MIVRIQIPSSDDDSSLDSPLKMSTAQVVETSVTNKSFWRLLSPGRSHQTNNWYSWVQTTYQRINFHMKGFALDLRNKKGNNGLLYTTAAVMSRVHYLWYCLTIPMLASTGIKNAIVQQYSTFTGYKNAFPAAAMFLKWCLQSVPKVPPYWLWTTVIWVNIS